MKLSAKIVGVITAQKRISEISERLQDLLFTGTDKMTIRMQTHIRMRHLSGRTLSRRSGNLSRAISRKMTVDPEKGTIEGRVFIGKNAAYGFVHEFGGTFLIPAHFRSITQAFGQPLGKTKRILVRAHLVTYPKRAFMAPTLRFFRSSYRRMVKAALVEAVVNPRRT